MPRGADSAKRTERLLIVGGTGFIGTELAYIAKQQGYEVSLLSISGHPRQPEFGGVELLQADIRALNVLREALGDRRYDYVVNCSGYINHSPVSEQGRSVIDTHFSGVMNLVECVSHNGLKGFVQIGSSDEYGTNPAPQRENARESPISPYSLAKVAATQFIQLMHRMESFPGVVLRLFLVYGPGQGAERFLPQVIQGCMEDKEFPVSAGEQLRDFCFVTDIVKGILATLKRAETRGKIINLGSGNPARIRDVIQLVRDTIGKGKPKFGALPYRAGENMELYADIENARKYLGWAPLVTLEEGIELTVRSFSHRASVV